MRLCNACVLVQLKYMLGNCPYFTLPPFQKQWITDKSDVKMEALTSTAKTHRKQVYMCTSKKTTHTHMYAPPPHTHTQSITILGNFSTAVIMN